MNKSSSSKWDLTISSKRGWFDIDFIEIWRYRDLLTLFVWRDFTTFYKQTILGPLWFFLQPFLSTIVMTVIFNRVAKIPTDEIPPILFYMSGIIAWNYFSNCLVMTSGTFTSNAGLFSKVYFPRIIVPLSQVISGLAKFLVQFILFILFFIYYLFDGNSQINISYNSIFILPILIFQMALLGQGIGMIVSSLTTKYRDLKFLISFGSQLMMYASPIVYPLSIVPEQYKYIIIANPMTPIIEGFRQSLMGTGTFNLAMFSNSLLVTTFIFLFGLIIFNKIEKNFYRYGMKNIALNITNLSKNYKLGRISTGTLSQDLASMWAKINGTDDPNSKVASNDLKISEDAQRVWALKDINLEVQQGEILGIIGNNGAGKSTLLKILSRITSPTSGNIKIKGRIASLLEVGTGFHPELTGMENIYLNGAILGMSKYEIKEKVEDIIQFSGIEKYIETPVKRYSSGMRVRLGFSVAAFLNPEILLVDEVLAVGDIEFRKKSQEK